MDMRDELKEMIKEEWRGYIENDLELKREDIRKLEKEMRELIKEYREEMDGEVKMVDEVSEEVVMKRLKWRKGE